MQTTPEHPHHLPLRLLLVALLAVGLAAFAPDRSPESTRADAAPAAQAAAPDLLGPVEVLPPPAEKWQIDGLTPQDIALVWGPGCPVGPEQLRKVTVTHWGFDGSVRQGTLIVNETIAEQTLNGFKALYEQQFPINRIDHGPLPAEADADPERNSTTAAFVCRTSRGSSKWSEHAYGTAFDINPFQNPMVKGGKVLGGSPEYVDRGTYRPGMLTENSPAVRAFTDQGLVWGGTWRSSKDWMHFSANGK